ncbi:MAG: nicotinate-nucleotide adenylyltransferase [Prevotellaceae bacterium]|jgi:nicotinate-nucleotide adenylyltransferase|nr:nicotinate-nucleotide adenylyltransferase [Prevotellaceae bacterium]
MTASKRIGLYFGSFNPIHNAHLCVSRSLIEQKRVDEVWLIVSPQNPLKSRDGLLDADKRLEMAKLAVLSCPDVYVSDVEFTLPQPSYTIDTLHRLTEQHPSHTFSLLIGADAVPTFDRWKNYGDILANYPVFVYPRRGFPLSDEQLRNMQLIDAPFYDLSATAIRALLKNGQPCNGMLPDAVLDCINRQKLYG